MTKKEFKELCRFDEYGYGQRKRNAIFYGYKDHRYKYMVKTNVQNYKKAELFNILYDWVTKGIQPDRYVTTRFAETDELMFKVPVVG